MVIGTSLNPSNVKDKKEQQQQQQQHLHLLQQSTMVQSLKSKLIQRYPQSVRPSRADHCNQKERINKHDWLHVRYGSEMLLIISLGSGDGDYDCPCFNHLLPSPIGSSLRSLKRQQVSNNSSFFYPFLFLSLFTLLLPTLLFPHSWAHIFHKPFEG